MASSFLLYAVHVRQLTGESPRFRRRWSRNGNLQSGEALIANGDLNLPPARATCWTPYADPAVRWCGRGEVTAPPIPILRWTCNATSSAGPQIATRVSPRA